VSTKLGKLYKRRHLLQHMFIELRKIGKKNKYYLIHTFRVQEKVKRISRYLGSDLNNNKLGELRKRAEEIILQQIKESKRLDFELADTEILKYKNFEKDIKIEHLNINWADFIKQFTYNTNAIEGSTVNYNEVAELLNKNEAPKNQDELETIEVANTIIFLKKLKEKELSLDLIKQVHYSCFNKTKSFAGKLRTVEVIIRDGLGHIIHQGAPSKNVSKLLIGLVDWYNKHRKKYPPLLLAGLLHNQFEEIHPFQDGNGRVGRLLLNFVLLTNNYPPISIKLKNRKRYYRVLRIFDKTGNINPTIKFLLSQYKK